MTLGLQATEPAVEMYCKHALLEQCGPWRGRGCRASWVPGTELLVLLKQLGVLLYQLLDELTGGPGAVLEVGPGRAGYGRLRRRRLQVLLFDLQVLRRPAGIPAHTLSLLQAQTVTIMQLTTVAQPQPLAQIAVEQRQKVSGRNPPFRPHSNCRQVTKPLRMSETGGAVQRRSQSF